MRTRVALLLASALAATLPVHAGSTQPSRSAASAPCVQVRIGRDSAGRLDCLNQTLRAEVDQARPLAIDVATDAQSPSRLGLPTPAEVKQRLGNAYGHSLVPQRPAQTYAPTLAPSH
ncbi:MAG TPA: hypothetical protein VGH80_11005 [Xanthomonadaceae bacterium]